MKVTIASAKIIAPVMMFGVRHITPGGQLLTILILMHLFHGAASLISAATAGAGSL
jgi:hypothetical protein